jgi:hypothetical protein
MSWREGGPATDHPLPGVIIAGTLDWDYPRVRLNAKHHDTIPRVSLNPAGCREAGREGCRPYRKLRQPGPISRSRCPPGRARSAGFSKSRTGVTGVWPDSRRRTGDCSRSTAEPQRIRHTTPHVSNVRALCRCGRSVRFSGTLRDTGQRGQNGSGASTTGRAGESVGSGGRIRLVDRQKRDASVIICDKLDHRTPQSLNQNRKQIRCH